MNIEHLYRSLPIPLQNVACSYYGWRERSIRLSRGFYTAYRALLQSDWANRSEIDAYQDAQVASLVAHAYTTVPYYRRVMDELGLKPYDIQSKRELRKMPVLRKEDVISNQLDLLSADFNRAALRSVATSGTTGKALRFWTTKEAVALQWAIWWRHRNRFGVVPQSWHANFSVRPVVPLSQKSPPYWRWSIPMKQALISMQHISPEKVRLILAFLEKHDFGFFTGTPSLIHSFCSMVNENGLKMRVKPTAIFLGAEAVGTEQRQMIERVTDAIVSDQYGFSEGCGNAACCPLGHYHEDWEFGVLECQDPESQEDRRSRGRILATGFSNYAFPFIRYDVGDVGVFESPDFRCNCGRSSQVLLEIDGRVEDYIETPEGTKIRRFASLFLDTVGVKEAQIVQREIGRVIIRVVPRKSFGSDDMERIRYKFHSRISATMGIDFEVLEEIPRSSSGKFRSVISEL